MAFEFWLNNENEKIALLLPVTPSDYEVSYGNTIETIGSTAIGDINIAGHRRLITVSISGFFTVKEYPFSNKQTYPASVAMDYANLLKQWVDDKAIIRLIITDGSTTKINTQFYIENISYSESDESNGDINYTIILREFKPIKTPSEASVMSENNKQRSIPEQTQVKTYTVVSGDYLGKIARKVYGDPNQWQKIYNANKSIIGDNPNIVYPGQVYIIS